MYVFKVRLKSVCLNNFLMDFFNVQATFNREISRHGFFGGERVPFVLDISSSIEIEFDVKIEN